MDKKQNPYRGQISNNGSFVAKGDVKDNGKRAVTIQKGSDLRVKGGKKK